MGVKEKEEHRNSPVSKMILQALPDVWSYSVTVSFLLCLPCAAFVKLLRDTFSTIRFFMNAELLKAFFRSWKAPFFCVFSLLFLVLFIFEFVAKFRFAKNFLNSHPIGFFGCMKEAVSAFFKSVKKPFRRKKNETEEKHKEKKETQSQGKKDFFPFIQALIIAPLVFFISYIFILFVPGLFMKFRDNYVPFGYHTPSLTEAIRSGFAGFYLTETDGEVLVYRVLAGIILLFGNFFIMTLVEMIVIYIILILMYVLKGSNTAKMQAKVEEAEETKEDTKEEIKEETKEKTKEEIKEKTKEETKEKTKEAEKIRSRKGYVILAAGIMLVIFLVSCAFGLFYEDLFNGYTTQIVAHRTGGLKFSENSLEGIDYAVECGCYASEIDVRLTKDGVFVVNHDDTFERMNGETTKIRDLTWEEIKNWLIPDTTGTNKVHRIYRLEDMLDAIKGREKLFIELKGATASEKCVDEIMKMVEERDEIEEVVLISFHPDAIEYAEEHYPAVDTGVLLFGKLDQKYNYNCDMILLEQDWATYSDILRIKGNKKQIGVWTVNEAALLNHFLRSKVDYIITDEIDLVEDVKREQDNRTDMERMRDLLYD